MLALLLPFLLCLAPGCASRDGGSTAGSIPAAHPARTATIGVLMVGEKPRLNYRAPMEKGDAVDATWESMSLGLADPVSALLLPIYMPVAPAIAHARGLTLERLRDTEQALTNAYSDFPALDALGRELCQCIQQNTTHRAATLPLVSSITAGLPRAKDPSSCDLLIELRFRQVALDRTMLLFGMEGEVDSTVPANPSLALVQEVQCRLVRAQDGEELFSAVYKHVSPRHKFAHWAANGAQLFQAELSRCQKAQAQRMVDTIFLGAPARQETVYTK
jgi:hypothetical protein